MSDSKILQISIESTFKELPTELSVSLESVETEQLTFPENLYDTQLSYLDTTLFNAVNPLIIIPDTDSSFTIIDGYKRCRHAKKNNRKLVPCMIIQTPCDTFTRGLLRIALNLHRPAHIREQYFFLSWLKSNSPEKRFTQIAQQAGFSLKNISQLNLLLSSESHIKEAMFENALDISLIELFLVFTSDDQLCFLNTFKDLKLSLQTQREFLDWLPEIAYTGKSTIRDILSEPAITETLESRSLNGPQKIQRIHTFLYTQKFPRLSEARNTWKKQAASCNPDPAHVSFTPHEYFEKNQLTISVSVTKADQATTIFKGLSEISLEQWQTLLYPIQKK